MNAPKGILTAMAVKAAPRAPMELRQSVRISVESGLEGDWRGRSRRQVTLVNLEDWLEAAAETGHPDLPWTHRRANLLISGLPFPRRAGWRISLGAVRLEVLGETDPCRRMDEQQPGLKSALKPNWRGGVFCRILQGGDLALGQEALIDP